MLKLTPKVYKQNIKQSLLTNNKIDTVNLRPISNLTADPKVFHTEIVNTISLNGTQYTLPIDNSVASTHKRTISNTRWVNVFLGDTEFAKARMDCVLVTGKTLCTVDDVITGTPTVKINLVGTSKRIARGGSTYENYPGSGDLKNNDWSLAQWISENSNETLNSFTLDYTGATFSMNPWVRNIVHMDSGVNPTANDVITDWGPISGGYVGPWWQSWAEESNFSIDATPQFRMVSPNTVNKDVETEAGSTLVMHDVHLPISASLIRIDDYNYEVSWQVPVRVAYVAASREAMLFDKKDVDNYAFLDSISEISIELSGIPISSDVRDISYGFDRAGNLTQTTTGNYPVTVDAGELFTLASYHYYDTGNILWTEDLAHKLLTKYKNGKYVVTCDVSAKWAIENNVHINTEMPIMLPDHSMISREGNVCVFEVKNITKSYKSSDFVFSLSLLEK